MDPLLKLKDIKPNIELVDYWFYLTIALAALFAVLALFFLIRAFWRKKEDPKLEYLKKLKNLDYADSKKTAYEFSEYARFFLTDENKKEYEEIFASLERYKYRPKVDPLESETVKKMKKFIEGIK